MNIVRHSAPSDRPASKLSLYAAVAVVSIVISLSAQAEEKTMSRSSNPPVLSHANVQTVAPALEKYMQGPLADLWKRPALAPRDRSIATIAALIARNQTIEMPYYFNIALDNGVKPSEVSEIITHLAFYSGWSNAFSAVAIVKDIFAQRGIGTDQLPTASPKLLPIDEAAEAQRAARVQQDVGPVAPGVVHYTG